MTTLLFDEHASETNNNFHKGFNVTVRRGLKYAHTLEINEEVEMRNLAGKSLGKATVAQMVIGPVDYIPQICLLREHDPKCRDMGGLIEVLQNCYNDPSIDLKEIVTAIVLEIK